MLRWMMLSWRSVCCASSRSSADGPLPLSRGLLRLRDVLDFFLIFGFILYDYGRKETGRETGLEEKRNESADVPAIAEICVAETLDHEVLFHRHLQVETDGAGEDGEEAADESVLQRRPEKSEQEAGVDGMAHDAVGAGDNQRVVMLDGGRAAPVFSE